MEAEQEDISGQRAFGKTAEDSEEIKNLEEFGGVQEKTRF